MTQRDHVLGLLRAAGPAGVHTFELRAGYIGNPSQRIAELEQRGYTISHARERLHGQATGTRYRLVGEPGGSGESQRVLGGPPAVVDSCVAADSPDAPALFTLPAAEPASPYEDAA